jgi:xanthine dehydrogenase accessory factor
MLAEGNESSLDVRNEQRVVICGPTGLDIGAEASEEIALSILAEIKAVLTSRRRMFLRNRTEGIHSRPVPLMKEPNEETL